MANKVLWKPGNMIYPVPAVMVTVADSEGRSNIITIAWTGTVCSDPPMAYISVRPERYSYHMLRETGEFVINLTTQRLAAATDYCGVRSGRDRDKWKDTGLTPVPASKVGAPLIKESPVGIECRVTEMRELGSHHMFLAEVVAVDADSEYLDEKGRLDLGKAGLLAYSHGEYYGLSGLLGTFGFSVKKEKNVQAAVLAAKPPQGKKNKNNTNSTSNKNNTSNSKNNKNNKSNNTNNNKDKGYGRHYEGKYHSDRDAGRG